MTTKTPDHLAARRPGGIALAAWAVLLVSLPHCGGGRSDSSSDNAATSTPVPVQPPSGPAAPAVPAVPAAPAVPAQASGSVWGAAPSSALTRIPETWLPAMADAGITTVRNFHDVPGEDKLAPILAAGMSAVGILQWSTVSPPSLPVDDLAGWRQYVIEEVSRHKGRVQYWEVWNEPPNFTEDKSPASYAKVLAVAFDAAKAVDPTVQIGLTAKSNHVNWLAETIAAGAANKFDFVTLHPYEVGELLPLGWEGQFMSIAPRVRTMLQTLNPGKAAVPLWFTEIGISAAPPPGRGNVGPLVQADVLVKIYAMTFAQGVSRIYWFDPRDSEGLNMGLTTADGQKRPAWQALRNMHAYLGAQPVYAGWTQPGHGAYGFVFKGPQGVVLAAWARPGQAVPLALANAVMAVEPRSGATTMTSAPTLTDVPVLLVAPPDSPQARQWLDESAARARSTFPWNTDHSTSSVVRMTAGEAPDGVFIVSPPPVTAYQGLSEYNVAGTIGACFAVDPGYMSYAYASSAVRITAQVRGHGVGDPGFEMRYESSAPIASTDINNLLLVSSGWYRIRGTGLQEKTWTLPDARFVGLYGYNFCFYAPTPDNAHFSIRQVTVQR